MCKYVKHYYVFNDVNKEKVSVSMMINTLNICMKLILNSKQYY